MSNEISRMYATAEAATNAAAELGEEGFDEIYVVHPPAAKEGSNIPVSAIAAQIAQGNVLLADARIYAEGVAKGGSLVTIHAPFGTGMKALNILESHGPIASGIPEAEPLKLWDEAAPMSSALMVPVLLDDPTPLSKFWGIGTLTSSSCVVSSMLGMPLLSGSGETPSSRWGLPFLSNNPAPLSSMLGLPLLKNKKAA